MAVESIGAVGSWFCSSWTRRLRKVVPVVLEARPLPEELLVVEPEPEVAAAFGLVTADPELRTFRDEIEEGAGNPETDIFPPKRMREAG
jgi:hypothetical protein